MKTSEIPHDLNTERCLLCCMMVSPSAAKGTFGAGIVADDFLRFPNIELFEALTELANKGSRWNTCLFAIRSKQMKP